LAKNVNSSLACGAGEEPMSHAWQSPPYIANIFLEVGWRAVTGHIQILATYSNLTKLLTVFVGDLCEVGGPGMGTKLFATRIQGGSWVAVSEKGFAARVFASKRLHR
jgi:hypothetical protein